MISYRGICRRTRLSHFNYRRNNTGSRSLQVLPQIHQNNKPTSYTSTLLVINSRQFREVHLSRCCLSEKLSEDPPLSPLVDNETTVGEQSFLPDHKFHHIENPSNAYEIRKQDLVRYLQSELAYNINWIIDNHKNSEIIAGRIEKKYNWKQYFSKEDILEQNEARLESRRVRGEGKEYEKMKTDEALDALSGILGVGNLENVTSEQKESEDVIEEDISSDLKETCSSPRATNNSDENNSLLKLLDGDSSDENQTTGDLSKAMETSTDSNIESLRYTTEGRFTDSTTGISASGEDDSSLLEFLEENNSNVRNSIQDTSDSTEDILATKCSHNSSSQSLLNDEPSAKNVDDKLHLQSKDVLHAIDENIKESVETKEVEKHRLLALFKDMNEKNEKRDITETQSSNPFAKSEVSLIDLLDNDLFGGGRGKKASSERPAPERKSLLQMLDDDFDEIFSDDAYSPPSMQRTTENKSYDSKNGNVAQDDGRDSLLDLISDDNSNRKTARQPLSSTSLLDLLKEDGMSHTRNNYEHDTTPSYEDSPLQGNKMKGGEQRSQESLVDLLDQDIVEDSSSNHVVTEASSPKRSKPSLIDLLDDDSIFDQSSSIPDIHFDAATTESNTLDHSKLSLVDLLDDESMFEQPSPKSVSSSLQDDLSQPKPQQDSLLALLNDESTKLQSESISGVEEIMENTQTSGNSLLDLLNNDDLSDTSGSPPHDTNKPDLGGNSMRNLLEDEDNVRINKFSTFGGGVESSSEDSLLSLLNDEENSESGHSEQLLDNKDSISDLLKEGEDGTGQSTSDSCSESMGRTDENSLVGLLGDIKDHDDDSIDEGHLFESHETELEWDLAELLARGHSLVSVLKKDDWKLVNQLHDSPSEIDVETSGEYIETQDDIYVEELITGSSMGKWNLTAEEFNMLLMHVAMSNSPQKIEILLDLYLHMKELSKGSMLSSETYTIFLELLNKIPGTSVIAADICRELIDRMEDDLNKPEGEKGSEIDQIQEETIEVIMGILMRSMNVRRAEILLEWSLSEFSKGVRVSPMVFKMMLMLYKSSNNQEKALQLVETCIKENEDNTRGVDNFLISAVNWPRRSRQGRKLAVGSHCEAMVGVLGGGGASTCSYTPSFNVWRKMLNFALYTANESPGKWELVQKCCYELVNHQEMSEERMDDGLLKAGLEVADRMRDPVIATEIICKTGTNSYTHLDANDIHSNESIFEWHPVEDGLEKTNLAKISPSSYIKAIKLCIECGQSSLADKILAHSSRMELPKTILSDIHSLVLTGYAKNGDSEKAAHIFDQMKMTGLKMSDSTYAAYIHSLVAGGNHKEVMDVLNSMLDGSNEDGVKPGISTFTACMVSAIKCGAFEDVMSVNEKMKGVGVKPNLTIFQGIIIANAQLGNKDGLMNAMETVIDAKTPVDEDSFLLCAKQLVPEILKETQMDVRAIRLALRKQVENNPNVAKEAMELNKTLTDCLREDQRKPSKMNNEVMIQQLRGELWRRALQDTIRLSKVL